METTTTHSHYRPMLAKFPSLYRPIEIKFPPSPDLAKDISEPFHNEHSVLPIQTLPRDIIISILSALDSLETLSRITRTSRLLYSIYKENPLSISLSIARQQFPPAAFELLDLWRPGGMSPLAREHMAIYAELGAVDTSLSPIKHQIGMPELRRLQADYNYIRSLVLSNRKKACRTIVPASSVTVQQEITHHYQLLALAKCFHPPMHFDATEQLKRPTGGRTPVPFDFTVLTAMPLSKLQRMTFTASKYRYYWPWARRLVWPQAQGPNLEEMFMGLSEMAGKKVLQELKDNGVDLVDGETIWERNDAIVRRTGRGELVDVCPSRLDVLCNEGKLYRRQVETVDVYGQAATVWCVTMKEQSASMYNPYGFH